jgi:hypothetical protein
MKINTKGSAMKTSNVPRQKWIPLINLIVLTGLAFAVSQIIAEKNLLNTPGQMVVFLITFAVTQSIVVILLKKQSKKRGFYKNWTYIKTFIRYPAIAAFIGFLGYALYIYITRHQN